MSPQESKPPIPYPGWTEQMSDEPHDEMRNYAGRGLLEGKHALVTGGDSGIGRAVSIAFAKEGADVAIAYLTEDEDAELTRDRVEKAGRRCVLLPGDLADPGHCREVVRETENQLGAIDVLVNNIATQSPTEDFDDIDDEQWMRTFDVNIHSYFRVTKAALTNMPSGGAIINTSSINGLRGNKTLIDYSATKGAILAWTYAMAQALVPRGIRMNCVAPGPVWTPLIPATMGEEKVEKFGTNVPYGRPAQPDELAPSYVFFASPQLSSYYTGEVLAPLGGETLPG